MVLKDNAYESDEFIGRWVSGDLPETEAGVFARWLTAHPERRDYFESLRRMYEERLDPPVGRSAEERWQRLYNSMSSSCKTTKPWWLSTWTYASAACVLVGLGLYLWYPVSNMVKVATQPGETRLVVLPDSSTIHLNAVSTLCYDLTRWDDHRSVEIKGEAFCDVRKTGTSFSVFADSTVTEVLGTSFNVLARENRLEVVCVTGSVEVRPFTNGGRITLTPGMATRRIGQSHLASAYPVDAVRKTGWIHDEIYFDREPLTSVFLEMERQFGIRIAVRRDFRGLTFTGKIDRRSLSNTLYILRLTADLSIAWQNDSTLYIH